jgi:hypothetical protein
MNRTQRMRRCLQPAAWLLLALSCPPFAQESPAASTAPVVVSAVADLVHNQMTITGQRLTPTTGSPVVTLDGKTLTLVSSASTQIVADLPAGLGAGTFQLNVSNGASSLFDVTIGTVGPQGPAGPAGAQGSRGAAGATGPAGPTGPTGATGPAGPTGPSGPAGATGPQGPIGPAGLFWEGAWVSSLAYRNNDAVYYNGSSYVAVQTIPAGQAPPSTGWSLLSEGGSTGATGPQGPQGVQGSQGPAGPQGPDGVALPFAGTVSASNVAFYVANTAGAADGMYGSGGIASGTSAGGNGVVGVGGNSNGGGSTGGSGVDGAGGDAAAIGDYGGAGGSFQGGGSTALGVGGGDGVDGYGGPSGGTGGAGNGIYGSPGQGYSDGVNWGLAGKFNGDVFVSGSLAKAGGSFVIDHPTDAANKYLYHSFVESPDMMNIYNGNVVTDAGGAATVTMPDWFEALNRDFRYQLTVIGQQAQAWVASEVVNRAFTIKTDKGNVKVSWQVTGIRQDAWANAHRIPVEVDKPAEYRGHYLHPELFGHEGEPSIGEKERAGTAQQPIPHSVP